MSFSKRAGSPRIPSASVARVTTENVPASQDRRGVPATNEGTELRGGYQPHQWPTPRDLATPEQRAEIDRLWNRGYDK